jgi:hypothetical protein
VSISFAPTTAPAVQARIEAWLKHRESIRESRTRLGVAGYAHLAAMLVQQPCTVPGLMRRAAMGHVAAYRFIGTLHALRYAHVAGWEMEPGRNAMPIWAFGPGADVPAPRTRPNGRPVQAVRKPRRQVCPGVLHFVQLLRTIEVPAGAAEVQAATGMHHSVVRDFLDTMQALELAHVPLYGHRPQGGGVPVPQYQLGYGRNAPEPTRVLQKQGHELDMRRQRSQRQHQRLHSVMQAFYRAGAQGGVA